LSALDHPDDLTRRFDIRNLPVQIDTIAVRRGLGVLRRDREVAVGGRDTEDGPFLRLEGRTWDVREDRHGGLLLDDPLGAAERSRQVLGEIFSSKDGWPWTAYFFALSGSILTHRMSPGRLGPEGT
jgi:hypothetical protein